jgi:multidrug efflux system outer membrane protein
MPRKANPSPRLAAGSLLRLAVSSALALASSTLLACASLAPRYVAPAPDTPDAFTHATAVPTVLADPDAATTTKALGGSWWTQFADPILDQLVERALAENLDLREAVARVEAARAARTLAGQAFLPTGDLRATRREHRASAVEAPGVAADERRGDLTSVGLALGWEIDLFGRLRAASAVAAARAEGAEAALDGVRLAVVAEVARTWHQLLASEERLALRQRQLAAQRETTAIVRARVVAGASPQADLARAEATVAEDVAAVAVEEQAGRALRHALAILVGETPGAWAPPTAAPLAPLRLQPMVLPAPAELLRQRPDVRAAERELALRTAEIGVATAGLFPQLHLGGFLGFLAGSTGDLGTGASTSWSIGPTLSWGVFDLGRVRSAIRGARADADAALAAYERAVLTAIGDTETALGALGTAGAVLTATETERRHALEAAALVEARYLAGMVGYFELLDARRAAVRAELARVDGIAGHRLATIDLLRALGATPNRPTTSDLAAVPSAAAATPRAGRRG